MKRRPSIQAYWPLIAGAAFAAAAYSTARAEPVGSASSAPDPSGTAAASPPARPAYVPDLDQPPPPADPSEAPSALEWLKATAAPEVRVTDPGCSAKRIREWYRVECKGRHASLVTGERRGVKVGYNENDYTVWVIFPAKRGDVRVVVLARLSKWSVVPNAIVSEQWLEGDRAPLITVTGVPD
jgi:hypothetical protein